MDPQLAKLMARRRRAADTTASSSTPMTPSTTTDTATTDTAVATTQHVIPPPPPPPKKKSSSSSSKKTRIKSSLSIDTTTTTTRTYTEGEIIASAAAAASTTTTGSDDSSSNKEEEDDDEGDDDDDDDDETVVAIKHTPQEQEHNSSSSSPSPSPLREEINPRSKEKNPSTSSTIEPEQDTDNDNDMDAVTTIEMEMTTAASKDDGATISKSASTTEEDPILSKKKKISRTGSSVDKTPTKSSASSPPPPPTRSPFPATQSRVRSTPTPSSSNASSGSSSSNKLSSSRHHHRSEDYRGGETTSTEVIVEKKIPKQQRRRTSTHQRRSPPPKQSSDTTTYSGGGGIVSEEELLAATSAAKSAVLKKQPHKNRSISNSSNHHPRNHHHKRSTTTSVLSSDNMINTNDNNNDNNNNNNDDEDDDEDDNDLSLSEDELDILVAASDDRSSSKNDTNNNNNNNNRNRNRKSSSSRSKNNKSHHKHRQRSPQQQEQEEQQQQRIDDDHDDDSPSEELRFSSSSTPPSAAVLPRNDSLTTSSSIFDDSAAQVDDKNKNKNSNNKNNETTKDDREVARATTSTAAASEVEFDTSFSTDLGSFPATRTTTTTPTKDKSNPFGGVEVARAANFTTTTSTSSAAALESEFDTSFSTDFGSFPATTTTTTTTPTKENRSNPFTVDDEDDDDDDGGGADYEPPSFANADFRGSKSTASSSSTSKSTPLSKPLPTTTKIMYDKSPIGKPPINQVESSSIKIKWIAPRPNVILSSSSSIKKNKIPSPVSNPLNGNVIVCKQSLSSSSSTSSSYDILEWNPQNQTQITGTSILTKELINKIVQKYHVTPGAVDNVWAIRAGVHQAKNGYERVRVAALIDLTILGDRNKEVLRVIAIWHWGYSDESSNSGGGGGGGGGENNPIQLQSVLSPPSGSDFTYDTESLLVCDGCIFVAGASTKGPCVFLSKPNVRETWSANFVGKNTDYRIAHMAIATCPKSPPDPDSSSDKNNDDSSGEERLPYMAIALTDGSLSLWTYEAATKLNGKTTETVRRLLFPLCRLDSTKALKTCATTSWGAKDHQSLKEKQSSETTATTDSKDDGVGHCTHLEWVPYRLSSYKQLLLLAASFQGALCLYHVALPKIQDKNGGGSSSKRGSYVDIKAPTEKTTLSQTFTIKPFCLSKWTSMHHKSSCSFVDLGPHVPPSLVVLLTGLKTNSEYARMALVTCPLPAYRGSKSSKNSGGGRGEEDQLAFHIWDTNEWTKRLSHLPRGLITSTLHRTRGILYYTDTTVQEIEHRTNTRFLPYVQNGSIPAGLTNSGTNYWCDSSTSAGVGVLSIYTTFHCERYKSTSSLSSDSSTPVLLEWTSPSRRHWLVQTFTGDSKESKYNDVIDGSNNSSTRVREEKENDDIVLGGSQSIVMCELVTRPKIQKLYPYRISRNPFSGGEGSKYNRATCTQHIAVWFRPLYGNSEPENIGLVEKDSQDGRYCLIQLIEGRDMVFLPNQNPLVEDDGKSTTISNDTIGTSIPQALVVSRNGGSVSLWRRNGTSDTLKSPWQEVPGTSYRPILGMEKENSKSLEDFVEFRQFVVTRFQDQVSLLAVASGSGSNSKCCLIAGHLVSKGDPVWSSLLPNVKEDPVLWLDEREQVSLVVPLPSEGSIRGGFGVATTQRIFILSPDLNIMAAIESFPPPGSLVPMGSYTVAYCSHGDHKVRYLSGLPDRTGRSGIIASISVPIPSYYTMFLVAIRPDRFIYNTFHNGTRLVERGQSTNSFLIPLAITRPALLLEPMVANAIAVGGNKTSAQPFLRAIFEKFGRKVATMSHGEGEGIGNYGAGMTSQVFELLEYYNLKPAASWLLTGIVDFDRSANSRLLPSHLPITAKMKAAFDTDTHLHLIANGDQYLTEYVKSPDNNMSCMLPRPSDPVAALCQQSAEDAIKDGRFVDAVKMLDIVGTQSTDAIILQLSLALQLDPSKDVWPVIDSLYQHNSQTRIAPSAVASLAALASELKKGKAPSNEFTQQWIQSLAPSVQRSRKSGRHRSRIIGESSLSTVGAKDQINGKIFLKEFPESKLVWNEGPNREKENLLMLDHIQEWFGRSRPIILGKEGAQSAEERGASTLAGILHSNDDDDEDDDSFGGENDDDFKDGWVDGIGEGLKDEDKLSAYFRFSEGEDEDAEKREGFCDITKFENTAVVVGNTDSFILQESTSSVDEGENGKVKALYDLVFEKSGVGHASALVIPSPRGGSLDLGLMHGPDHISRQKCTIEFWVWVPESIKKEIILVRRTFGSSADDFDNVCKATNKSNVLWELGLKTNGELEFRTIAGKSIRTKPKEKSDDDDNDDPTSTIHFSRWNHICIIMKQESITSSIVSLLARGTEKANSSSLSFSPPGFEVDDFSGASALDPMLENSHLIYGLNHPKGFRMTELRVWALERKKDDIRALMTEYLECAEIKRKFKVKIKKKGGNEKGTGINLAPPKGGLLAPPGGLKSSSEGKRRSNPTKKFGLLAPPKQSKEDSPVKISETPPKQGTTFGTSGFSNSFGGFGESPTAGAAVTTPVSFAGSDGFGGRMSGSTFDSELHGENLLLASPDSRADNTPFQEGIDEAMDEDRLDEEEEELIEISPLWESAIPLSEQVRSSAAAALIRGPPATRHLGGNRGGLPDYRELDRFGVGAISICGSEKTIVWRDDQVPPGLTYPIGASGAIVSDQMDGDGSEFLCCFMAKDKRMVVFELSTRTVVVELQMTTKLNYWRFLPPEAGEDTLCFMLITPVGGFHWMPLDESPRPRQVWKRGDELQGKKIVCYEEGGSNGFDGPDMLSKVGLLLATDSVDAVGGGNLEAWLVPICGDSQAICASSDTLGACLCQPPGMEYEPFMPLMLFVVEEHNELIVCVSAITEDGDDSIAITDVMTDALIEQGPYHSFDFEPPTLAMGTYPEILCCSLGTTVVVIVRRKGLVIAYELAETGLELIAQENVGHYVVDAVMRYSAVEGGAEIVLLMSDSDNRRDGRVGTFCFRAAC